MPLFLVPVVTLRKDAYFQEYNCLVAAKFFCLKEVDWKIDLLSFAVSQITRNEEVCVAEWKDV